MRVTAPPIAALLARPRMWAHRHVKAGHFGPAVKGRGRALEVELAEVAELVGIDFTPAQLAAAGLRIPTEPHEELDG